MPMKTVLVIILVAVILVVAYALCKASSKS